VAGHGAHITAMVRSHASGDEDAFYSVALQVAAREARQGHHRLASDIKKAIDSSRQRARSPLATVATLPRPEGDIAGLVEIAQPQVRLRDLVISPERRRADHAGHPGAAATVRSDRARLYPDASSAS